MDLTRITCRNGHFPVSLSSEGALLFRELARVQGRTLPESPTWLPLRLYGPLDPSVLEHALNEIVRRHDALRLHIFPNLAVPPFERQKKLSLFARTGIAPSGMYLQSVAENPGRLVVRSVVRSPDPSVRDRGYQKIVEEDMALPFEGPPLMRASLVTMGAEEHLLLITVDHMVSDRWSLRLIQEELAALYASSVSPGRKDVPTPAVSYPDFVACQFRWLQTEASHATASYWRDQWSRFAAARIGFDDVPFVLPPPKDGSVSFERVRRNLDDRLARALRGLARELGVTLYMTLLSSYAVLLGHYTGKTLLAIWSNFANRKHLQIRRAVGFFSTIHLVGIDLTADPSVTELAAEVRSSVLGALENQEMPLPHLWKRLRCYPLDPDPVVLLDYIETNPNRRASPTPSDPPLVIRRAVLPPGAPFLRRSSLGLYVLDDGTQISLESQFASTLFPPNAVEDLLRDLQSVLETMVKAPGARVSEFASVARRYPRCSADPDSTMKHFLVSGADRIPQVD